MNTYLSTTEFKSNKKTIVTIGTFDGVHLGHQKIINKLLNSTENNQFETIILTFLHHPRLMLNSNDNIKLLNTNDEKINLLQNYGISNVIFQPFLPEFSNLSGEDFVKKILVDQLNIHKIIIGYDHKFGKNRSCDIHDLVQLGKKYNFEVEQISAKEINEVSVSSTQIRNAIENGNITLTNQFLGYNFSFTGIVEKGKQLGRTIGFATANLEVVNFMKIIPKNGVYIVKGHWGKKTYQGMMNIGKNPTFNEQETKIEVHFFNFNEDIYNKKIQIEVLQFIRNEQKFESVEALKIQLQTDKNYCLTYFENENLA